MRSFFVCGDVNQRLTTWGLKSNDDLDWLGPNIQRKSITVSYRQSGRLVSLAGEVAAMGGAKASDTVLPDRVDVEGEAPVWTSGLADNSSIAAWLTERIEEIDWMVQKATTIAEAVFFVGLDHTISTHPDLFTKYLYVGATRAATYLGITFDGEIPKIVQPLKKHFEDNWRM